VKFYSVTERTARGEYSGCSRLAIADDEDPADHIGPRDTARPVAREDFDSGYPFYYHVSAKARPELEGQKK
jgi:hypothetical protein